MIMSFNVEFISLWVPGYLVAQVFARLIEDCEKKKNKKNK